MQFNSMDFKDAKKQVGSFWSYLFPKNEGKDWIKNSLGEIISKENIDTYIAELDLDSAKDKLQEIFNWNDDIANGDKVWQDYFETCKGGKEYIKNLIKNTDDLSKLTGEDLVKANKIARQSAIDHNAALKQQTLSAKAGQVALKGLAFAGKLAANIGLSLAINAIVTWITEFVNREKEAIETAKEAAKAYEEKAQKLSELTKQYEDILDSTDSETEKTQKLNEWKNVLIDTYGFEKSALEKINLEREKGIKLLQKEIDVEKRKERNNWLSDNGFQGIDENGYQLDRSGTINKALAWMKTDDINIRSNTSGYHNNISESILSMFDDVYNGGAYISGEIQANNNRELYDKIQDILDQIGEIASRRKLTEDEINLRDSLEQKSNQIKKYLDEYESVYNTFYQYLSENKLEDYIKDNPFSEVGADTYNQWRKGLLSEANGDNQLQKVLEKQLANLFPDFEKQFQNKQEAFNKFLYNTPDHIERILNGQKRDFIESLSDIDLDILVNKIEDPFKEGIIGAEKAIEEFKKNNDIGVQVDTDPFSKLSKIIEKLDESFSKLTSKAKTLSSALKEQDEAGALSADTIMDIVDAGYASALVFDKVTGKVTLNKEAYVQLAKAEYDEQIANLETGRRLYQTYYALSDFNSNANEATGIIYGIASAFLEVQKSTTNIPEQIAEIDARIAALKTARDNVGNYDTGTTTDHIREAFEEEMKDIEHLHNMGLISDEEYYNALEKANENHYKGILEKESEYNSNIEKIYNGRKNIYKENVDKQAEELEKAYKKGFLTAKEYRSEMQKLAETSYGVGTIYFNTEFASENYDDLINKSLDLDSDIYEEELEKIKEAEDGTLETHQKVVEKWKNLNSKMFEGIDPRKYKENLEEIEKADQDFLKDYVDKQISDLEEAFDKGIITAEELQSKLQNLADTFYGEGTIYFGTDFATENYSSIMDKVNDTNNDVYKEKLDELKKADDGSLESHKEFIENWKQLASEMFEGVNPKKYKEILEEISKEEEDFWNDRVEKEKEYWENQKQAVIDYYDEEIKKLEDIADEEERINKQEELRLNLIKAQQDLLNAKKNRSQLVFSNGGFEYTYDQEAVGSASEAVKNAEQAIAENERKEEIELLKEQKAKEEEYYDQILEIIGFYIKKSVPLTESDKEVFDEIMNSPYAELANQETQINPKAELPQKQSQSNESKSSEDKSDKKSEQKSESKSSTEFKPDFSNLLSESKFLMEAINSRSVEGMSKVFDFVGESVMQAAQYPMWGQSANPVYNNSTITNNNNDNKQITIGDIHVNVQGGTSDEMINEFSQKLSAALVECATKEIYSRNKR